MTKEELIRLKQDIAALSEADEKERRLYLRGLANGDIQGPPVGYPSIDQPWLKYYSEKNLMSDIPNCTMYEFVSKVARNKHNSNAIYYLGTKVSYNKMMDNIDIVAKGLTDLGIKKGDIVTLAIPNTPENVYCIYALSKIGAIANIIDLRMCSADLKKAIEETDSKVFIGSSVFLENIVSADLKNVDRIIISSPSDSLMKPLKYLYDMKNKCALPDDDKYMKWNDFFNKSKKSTSIVKIGGEAESPVCMFHTSGTTGKPKSVILTNKNLNTFPVEYKNSFVDLQDGDKFLNQMPSFLAYNAAMGMHLPLGLGLNMVMLPDYNPKEFVKNVTKYKINHVVAGPADCYNFLEVPLASDLSFIKTVASGSDKINETQKAEIEKALQSRNSKSRIIEGYGMTEVSSGATTEITQVPSKNTIGVPLPKMTVAIFDPETNEEKMYNEDGEICITGPTIMKEYFNEPEETANIKFFDYDGKTWIHSADIGSMDENGFIYFKGRVKRVIIRHEGFKIFPVELERVIEKHPLVENSCVVGIPDLENGRGYKPIANIVLKGEFTKEEEQLIIEEIKDLCEKNLGERYRPQDYLILPELPLTPVSKIDYRKLEEIDAEEKEKAKTLVLINNKSTK